jgi:hypothetical protein
MNMSESILEQTGLLEPISASELFQHDFEHPTETGQFVKTKYGRIVRITKEDFDEYHRIWDEAQGRYLSTGMAPGGLYSHGVQTMIATQWLLKVLAR